jgi:hypothetical protein
MKPSIQTLVLSKIKTKTWSMVYTKIKNFHP